MRTEFRIKFDVPVDFCTEPGYIRQVHCHDFRPVKDSLKGTWQDPLTGLIMLEPNFLTPGFSNTFRGLDNWLRAEDAMNALWQEVDRARDTGGASPLAAAPMMTFSIPEKTGTLNGSLDFVTSLAITNVKIKSLTALADLDIVETALESIFPIAPDQSFVLHFHGISDQMHRKKNWFGVIWDKYMVHFSMDGSARIAEYETRGEYADAPTIIQEFQIASPSELLGKDGFFWFLPIPGYGLRIMHGQTPQALPNLASSARSNANRGVLIPLPTRTVDGFATVFNESKVWLSVNPWHPMVLGFQEVVYDTDTAASFLDSTFDPGYKPSLDEDDVSAFVPATPLRGAMLSASLRKPDDSAAWSANPAITSGDRQARVKIALQTTDQKYTPFLLGYGVKWLPVRHTRATTPVAPKSLWRLEFSEDVLANFEGHCTVLMETADQRKIVERGDTTFLIEKSTNGGSTWTTVNGGLAQIDGEVSAMLDMGGPMYYIASWRLVGMAGVFDEMTQILENAFDGLTPGDGVNIVLNACGFSFIDSLPAALTAIKIPQTPKGQNWRFAPREGDRGDQIIRDLLLLVKKQYQEWRLRFNWVTQKWVAELRTHDLTDGATWTFTAFEDEAGNDRAAVMAAGGNDLFSFSVTPPECNVVQPFGLTSPDQNGERVPGTPIINLPSLNDPDSPDYLGRYKNARPLIGPLENLQWINWMGRRVYDAAAHRRVRPTVVTRDYIDALKPGTHVKVRSLIKNAGGAIVRGNLFTAGPEHLWIKRRTVVLDYNRGAGEIAPVVSYALDSVWDSEL